MTPAPTPTPRTDAAEDEYENASEHRGHLVRAKFARQLEHELTAAKQQAERLAAALKAEEAAWLATEAFDKHAQNAHSETSNAYWDEFYRLEGECGKLTDAANDLRRKELAAWEASK